MPLRPDPSTETLQYLAELLGLNVNPLWTRAISGAVNPSSALGPAAAGVNVGTSAILGPTFDAGLDSLFGVQGQSPETQIPFLDQLQGVTMVGPETPLSPREQELSFTDPLTSFGGFNPLDAALGGYNLYQGFQDVANSDLPIPYRALSGAQTGLQAFDTINQVRALDPITRLGALFSSAPATTGTALAPAAANAAPGAAQAPGVDYLGGAGTALGLAATGYDISNILNDPDLSRTQQVGRSGRAVADLIMSLAIPYYGPAKAISAIGQQLEGSGSPQVRGLGRTLDYAAEPAGAKAFWDVVTGMRSPRAAFKAHGGWEGLTLDAMGPVGLILRGLGVNLPFLHHTPTTGTTFRKEVSRLFDQIPELRGTDTSRFNMEGGVEAYNAFSVEARTTAEAIARNLGPLSPTFTKQAADRQAAYTGQLANILLNRFGESLTTFGPALLQSFQPQETPTAPAGGFSSLLSAAVAKMAGRPNLVSRTVS